MNPAAVPPRDAPPVPPRGVLGVVHLLPLPGSPGYGGRREAIRDAALADAEALVAGGCDGVIIENFGDTPFRLDRVEPSVIADMTALAAALRDAIGERPLGINVLRNDARAALSIAAATGASFIRVNVHLGIMYGDTGLLTGHADETLRLRRTLDAPVAILADVAVKHATPPPGFDLTRATHDLVSRGGADGVIVTGSATGAPADLDELQAVCAAASPHPVYVGSGVTAETVRPILTHAAGVIVGTTLKEEGQVERPVDRDRVAALVQAARG